MRAPSTSRLAPLTFWVVGLSVAIAVVGSSTFLFPGPDIGERPAAPSGRDIVARVVAPLFGPSSARERDRSGPPAAAAPAALPATFVADAPLVLIPAAVTNERPVRGRDQVSRPRGADRPPAAREDGAKGEGKAKGHAKGVSKQEGKAKAGKPSPAGHAVAGAKSQGHGPLESRPPRGPKQPHVQPAHGHGKAKGKATRRARAHARAGR
jgi:hypothetical protein